MEKSFLITDNEVKLELNKNNLTSLKKKNINTLRKQEGRYGTNVDLNTNKVVDKLDKYTTRNKLISDDDKYRITRINIDSRFRDKNPINIIDKYINTANQLVFTELSDVLKIMMPLNHGLSVDDFITITNLKPKTIIQKPNTFTLKKNSKYIYINHVNHQFSGTNNYYIDILTYNGIHIKYINASYPISTDIQQGYHIITETSTDYIKIKLSVLTELLITPIIDINNDVLIGKIVKSITGYPDPEFYKIKFKSYYNIKKIKLVSTEIPNTEMLIKSNTSFKNNSLYWQILEDGDYIYSISVSAGNYDAASLQTEIFNKISSVSRKFGSYLTSSLYNSKCIPIISINPSNNLFTMQLMGNITLNSNIVIYNGLYTDNYIRLNITHPYHNLVVGDKITISGAVNVRHTDGTLYIPITSINISHTIEFIIDSNNYIVKLSKYNPTSNGGNDQTTTITNGGNAVNILFPLAFRLLFNYTDTVGRILGFTNLGNENSITIYSKSITNNTLYINASNINSVGLKNLDVAMLNFQTYPYILMTSTVFNATINYKVSNGVFAKLFLTGNPGSLIYDQYVQITEDVPSTNSFINEMEFKFLTPDGNLYNFNGYEHSYTLEIYEQLGEARRDYL